MRSAIIFLWLILTGFCAQGQHAAVELTKKLNVLYHDLPNPIKIVVADIPASRIVLKSDALIISGKEGNYTLEPKKNVLHAELHIGMLRKHKDTLWLETREYRVRWIDKPLPMLGTKTSGTISMGELKVSSFISAGLPRYGYVISPDWYNVLSYRVTYLGNGLFFSKTYSGNRVQDTAEQWKDVLRPGDEIIISDVKAQFMYEDEVKDTFTLEPIRIIVGGNASSSMSDAPVTGRIRGSSISKDGKTAAFTLYLPQDMQGEKLQQTRHGRWAFYRNCGLDTPYMLAYYDHGRLLRTECLDALGRKESEITYNAHTRKGEMKLYYENGSLKVQGGILLPDSFARPPFVEELDTVTDPYAIQQVFDTSGVIDYRISQNGFEVEHHCLRYGRWQEYYPSGNLRAEGWYDLEFTPAEAAGICKACTRIISTKKAGEWKYYDLPEKSMKLNGFGE